MFGLYSSQVDGIKVVFWEALQCSAGKGPNTEREIVKRRDMIFSRPRIFSDFDYFVQERILHSTVPLKILK